MQTNKLNNLIKQLYYGYSNSNVQHYYVKHNNKLKHVKKLVNSLAQATKHLYKNYKCSLKTLNFIQFAYNTQNVKYNLSFKYAVCNYKTIKNCINSM